MQNFAPSQYKSVVSVQQSLNNLCGSYHFNSEEFPRSEQLSAFNREFSLWRQANLPAGKRACDGLRACCTGYALGGLHVVMAETEAHSFSSAPLHGEEPPGAYWVLTLHMEGSSDIEVNGSRSHVNGSRVDIHRLGAARSGYLSDNRSLHLFLPRQSFSGLGFLLDNLADGVSGPSIHPLLGSYLGALGRVLPTLSQSDAVGVADATTAMVRACVSYDPALADATTSPVMTARFEQARVYIERNLKAPTLHAGSLASALCVSRRQLYKMFEDHGGVSRYIRKRRLDACYKAILESRDKSPIAEIADEHGFADMARFGQAFRARFGCSPSELREQAYISPGPTSFEKWLLAPADRTSSWGHRDAAMRRLRDDAKTIVKIEPQASSPAIGGRRETAGSDA